MLCKNAQKRVEYRSISPKIWALKRIDSVAIYDRNVALFASWINELPLLLSEVGSPARRAV